MKKILVMLISLCLLTATAFAAETAAEAQDTAAADNASMLCFITDDGLVPMADYEATFHYLVENNITFDGTEEKPLEDNNSTRMHLLSQYTDANHLAVSYGWNKKDNYLTINIAQAEATFDPRIVMQHMQNINNIFVNNIDAKSKNGPDGIMKKEGTITLIFAAGKTEPVGVWRHGMKVDKEKHVYTDSSYMVLAMATPVTDDTPVQEAPAEAQAE